ncbi:MAG: hypothetical protein COC15_04135 [Legionellales bacterium]|nr:MAG: hypothetical protein COC15_04135 [Legionellales bacterium]
MEYNITKITELGIAGNNVDLVAAAVLEYQIAEPDKKMDNEDNSLRGEYEKYGCISLEKDFPDKIIKNSKTIYILRLCTTGSLHENIQWPYRALLPVSCGSNFQYNGISSSTMLLNEYSRYDFKDLLSFFDKIKCPTAVKQMKALEEREIFEFKNKQLQSIIEESSRNVDVESDVLVLNKEFESKEVQDCTDIPKEIVLKVNNIFYKFHVSKLLQAIQKNDEYCIGSPSRNYWPIYFYDLVMKQLKSSRLGYEFLDIVPAYNVFVGLCAKRKFSDALTFKDNDFKKFAADCFLYAMDSSNREKLQKVLRRVTDKPVFLPMQEHYDCTTTIAALSVFVEHIYAQKEEIEKLKQQNKNLKKLKDVKILNQLDLSKSKTSDAEDYKQNKDPKNKL